MPWQLGSVAGIFLVLSFGAQSLEASPTAPQGVCSEGLQCSKKATVTLGLLQTKTRPNKSKMFEGEREQVLVEHAEVEEKTWLSTRVGDKLLGGPAIIMTEGARSKQKASSDTTLRSYGPYPSGRALEYFMKWSHGSVESKVRREFVHQFHVVTEPALLQHDSERNLVKAASILATAEQEKCGNSSLRRSWSLLEKTESRGVEHMVLRSTGTAAPKFQYLALQHEKILVADPPVACMMQIPGLTVDTSNSNSDGGREDLLHPETDEAVKDCKKLFVRTATDICQKNMKVKVLSANRKIIDGFEINMDVEITGPLGKTYHHPSCLFETSLNHTDASLLQHETTKPTNTNTASTNDPAVIDPTETEKSGLVATLAMHTELCEADEKNGTTTSWVQQVAFGELSLYKGFEHVNDELGLIEVPLREGAPTEVDHREMFPECFPEDGKETVRNQGQCGSCWAFASASAAMNNLCTSGRGKDSLASIDDRYEVSVQQIMSCNEEQCGCDGGYAAAAHDAFMKTNGPSKERDYPYKCGSGDPHNHFELNSGDCDNFPWGASCVASNSAVPGWMWSGVSAVSGEDSMKALIADGNSLYVSMKVYGNFMGFTTGVYTELAGGEKGGHAMVGMGYGTEGGTPYWLLQNSWGPGGWGVEGFGKVLRGSNLAGIETDAYWIKAWVSGGREPECSDGPSTGLTSGGQTIPCSDAKGTYGDLCTDSSWGPTVRGNCPKTCDSCLVVGTASAPGEGRTPAPAPAAPTLAPTPVPTPMPPTPVPTPMPAPGEGQTPAPAPAAPTLAPTPVPTPMPPTPVPTPMPPAIDGCVADATSIFRGMFRCVVRNKCSQSVKLKCKSSPCTQQLPAGIYAIFHCNGQLLSEVCDAPSECDFLPA